MRRGRISKSKENKELFEGWGERTVTGEGKFERSWGGVINDDTASIEGKKEFCGGKVKNNR